MARSNLAVRVLTSAIAAPLLLVCLFWSSPLVWLVVVTAAAALAGAELFALLAPSDRIARLMGVLVTLLVVPAISLGVEHPNWLLPGLLVLILSSLLVPLFRPDPMETVGLRLMASVTAPLYVGGLLSPLVLLHGLSDGRGARWVLLVFTMAWLGDTAAYFSGRRFGRTKLYPRVSPNKTRAGLVGALAGSALAATLASATYLPVVALGEAVILGLATGLFGQLGDLVESLVKRSSNVKDSGNLLPGHGGLLDRIDAVLFVGPVVYLYVVWRIG